METIVAIGGLVLILAVLLDAFETIVLPRRVMQRVRLASALNKLTWAPWRWLSRRIKDGGRREGFLSFYGPLYLIILVAVWATCLIFGFGALHWAFGSALDTTHGDGSFFADLYLSGSTFFTLGLGDVAPVVPVARFITIAEAGIGFTFLALIIGYLPALNGAFSVREVNVSLLDGRAGSPPSAVELLTRNCQGAASETLKEFLKDWERWSAQLLESHLSYPVLGFFRSQHENESWVASLTMILDTCALVLAGGTSKAVRQAQLTFAIARHAAVDLSQIYNAAPIDPEPDRLPPDDFQRMLDTLNRYETDIFDGTSSAARLHELRAMYEPYVCALSRYMVMGLPPWLAAPDAHDAWETTAWEGAVPVENPIVSHMLPEDEAEISDEY